MDSPLAADLSSVLSLLTDDSEDLNQTKSFDPTCSFCNEPCFTPKIAPCDHIFCSECIEKLQSDKNKIPCPKCDQDSASLCRDLSALAIALSNGESSDSTTTANSPTYCTACKTKDTNTIAFCFDCVSYLCENCVRAHNYMHCFEGHCVVDLKELETDKVPNCFLHLTKPLVYFCNTCSILICEDCTFLDHSKDFHDYDHISKVGPKQVKMLEKLFDRGNAKTNALKNVSKEIETISSDLHGQYLKAKSEISDTFDFYSTHLVDHKDKLMRQLKILYASKMALFNFVASKLRDVIKSIQLILSFVDGVKKSPNNSQLLMLKQVIDYKMENVLSYNADVNLPAIELEFLSNYKTIQIGVKNTFGYIRCNQAEIENFKPEPEIGSLFNDLDLGNNSIPIPDINSLASFVPDNNFGPLSSNMSLFDKESYNVSNLLQNLSENLYDVNPQPDFDSNSRFFPASSFTFPPLTNRHKMAYHCKFGEFGTYEGQFTEPGGVAVNANNDIIIADTNSHRIQIFDKEGRFKFQFGECGKSDGQLLYPNRVAVFKKTGDIIVSERSPTHQIQIYNQYGQFVRKFGTELLQHPRAVAVDNKGLIVVVECKVMRVVIFSQFGMVMQKFNCAKYLEFPNGVVVNDYHEIFISDNRDHCVKVFNYNGQYVRQIGGKGLTNYPIGVSINMSGNILIADNHNNFNITLFTQDGQLVYATESKIKHAQCFDIALMDDESVVLSSKDYRVYVYRYLQASPSEF
ncbi:B-box type zinc finger protein ncl-1-like [Uloborus diversus]|uniref:B-box type zinc finger protein ncl-1-like n=1 Tax=Uloborus diversus TaxID=327109 RepID=UPI002409619A|nr:B-box type zinc finger protein ncl-1-like [Uloborus diversus]